MRGFCKNVQGGMEGGLHERVGTVWGVLESAECRGKAHCPRVEQLWMKTWIHHMYAYGAKWATFGRLAWFTHEGSYVRLKRMP